MYITYNLLLLIVFSPLILAIFAFIFIHVYNHIRYTKKVRNSFETIIKQEMNEEYKRRNALMERMKQLQKNIINRDMNKIIEKFKKETGYELTMKGGRLFYDGCLDLSKTKIKSLPDNLTVSGYLDLNNTEIEYLPDNLVVSDSLYLYETKIKELPNNLIVGNSLYLNKTKIRELPNNLTIGGGLYLTDSKIQELPDNLNVGENLYLNRTEIKYLPENLIVGGSFDFKMSKIRKLPDNLTVGGWLDLCCTRLVSFPNNLTVKSFLDLNKTYTSDLPQSLTVGGEIYTYYTNIKDTSKVNRTLSPEQREKLKELKNRPLFWELNGVSYIKVDGIFSVIDSHHGNVYKVHKLGQEDKPLYLVTDGDNHWAHGATIAEAKADLIYKINDRDTSAYKNLSLDDMLSFEESIAAYRIITGACSAGTRDFIENRLPSPHKDKYTVKEIIELTTDEYGGKTFAKFFK